MSGVPASELERPAAPGRPVLLALLAAFAFSCWGFFLRLDDYPPWLDYDSATLGIFVNNVSFHDDYAFGFSTSPIDQDQYRARWAAQFLPASVALSALQRLLGVPPRAVGALLEVVSLLLGALGLGCVALVQRRRGAPLAERLFVFGLTASLPAFLLYLRTTEPHFLYSFAMFWGAVALVDAYTSTGSRRAVLGLGLLLGLYLPLAYVHIAALPIVGLLLAVVRRRVLASLRDPALYAAAALAVVVAAGIQFGVASTHEESWEHWRGKSSQFVAARSRHALPGLAGGVGDLEEKLGKLWHQHFAHRWDDLGDRTRNDHLWTLTEPHLAWLLLVPFALLGIVAAARTRDSEAAVFSAVLAASYGFALTAGFPEGRYVLVAVPALAWFTLRGLRTLAGSRAFFPLLLATLLVAVAANSLVLVRGPYNDAAMRRWRQMAGMPDVVELLQRRVDAGLGVGKTLNLHWPGLRYEGWLYLQMLGNMRVAPFPAEANLASLAPGEPLFAALEEDDGELSSWKARGFQEIGRVTDEPSGRRKIVLMAPP